MNNDIHKFLFCRNSDTDEAQLVSEAGAKAKTDRRNIGSCFERMSCDLISLPALNDTVDAG